MKVEVLLTPAEFGRLASADRRQRTCVVVDVLRATSSMVTALVNGARAILPVGSIEEAVAERRADEGVLLAGERQGLRIGAAWSDGVEFDLGNSPREFTEARVRGRTVVMTTTNGTRALSASAGAARVLVAAFLNLGAVAAELRQSAAREVCVVCSGTGEGAAYEDTLMAGALVEALGRDALLEDSSRIALSVWREAKGRLAEALREADNAARLLGNAELAADVDFCLQQDCCAVVPELWEGREVRLRG